MQNRLEGVAQRGDGRRRSEDACVTERGTHLRRSPAAVSERERSVVDDQPRFPGVVDDDGAVGELRERNGPQLAIAGPIEARTTTQAFSGQTLVHLDGTERFVPPERTRESVAIRRLGLRPARAARAMTGRQRDGVVEEEEWRPGSRCVERVPPVTEAREARDPEVAAVVTHEVARCADEAPPVAGEHAPLVGAVKITPRIDAVPTGAHASPVSRTVMLSRPGGRSSHEGAVPSSTFGTPW